ncbi:hypothetical protein BGW38_001088 [Lunasporangiospora selenospora]|uniref:Drebrin-like protein n=1 Tax=Lunasporangiospora selenospora TaxID=979761 RepID=A0A9P6FUS8_9FUNG|nr:hypothetical protein BGW38_001088 [Lunasporangiospora selenospora]
MSLQVNFTTHGQELRAAYEAVLKPSDPNSSDNNWALFGYDKGTNDLKVLGQGDGGLEELEEEFSDTKIQFAFVRVQDPYSKLNKFVFINWCGDGVPESKKGLFNTHVADVALFLKGYHLQINARCEADVTPAQIMKRLDEGSGSKYSTHKESYRVEKIQPLQSAYKKTEIPDIAAMQRNPTKPEAAPQDRWNPSAASTATTSPPSSASKPAEKSWKAVGGPSFAASSASFNKVTPPASLLSYGQQSASPNEPSMNKAQQIRLEREAREREERERIKREIAASEAREQQTTVQTTAQRLAEERRLQEQKEREREREQEATSGSRGLDRAREERAAQEEAAREKAAQAEEDVKRQREQQQRREKEEHAEAQASARRIQEQQQQEEEERRREQEQNEEEERYRKQQQEEDDKRRKQQQEEDDKRRKQQQEEDDKRRKQQQEDEEKRRKQQQEEEEKRRKQQEEEAHQQSLAASQPPEAPAHSAASGGVSAVVLYSYEKAEENEMSLIEGEVILNVTELDVGWWSGESKDGTRSGLFPANYVEVIESEEQPANGAAAGYEEDYPEPAAAVHAAPAGAHNAAASSKPTAIALYDYAAGEPNEITFSEGETIIEIEFVTEDWWSGSSVDHTRTGLFPCTFFSMH